MPATLRASLEAAGVAVRPYDQAEAAVAAFSNKDGVKLMLDPERINFALRSAAGAAALEAPSPLALPKALKNSAELAGMRAALEDLDDGEVADGLGAHGLLPGDAADRAANLDALARAMLRA